MKITVFTGHAVSHPEVDIRCREKDREVERIVSAVNACSGKIPARIDEEHVLIAPTQALYFESVDKKTYVYLKNQVAEVALRLFEITDAGLFFGYVRISKSMVVNIIHVKKVLKLLNGNLDLAMSNDEHVIVSRRFVPDFNRFIHALTK